MLIYSTALKSAWSRGSWLGNTYVITEGYWLKPCWTPQISTGLFGLFSFWFLLQLEGTGPARWLRSKGTSQVSLTTGVGSPESNLTKLSSDLHINAMTWAPTHHIMYTQRILLKQGNKIIKIGDSKFNLCIKQQVLEDKTKTKFHLFFLKFFKTVSL